MQPTWIVLADEGRARILQLRKSGADLEEVEELTDDAAHAHNADFRHDAAGRRAPAGTQGGVHGMRGGAVSSAGESKLDHEAEAFARRLAARLAEAQREHRYERLRIAAAPKFLGRLRKALDHAVSDVVDDEIDKDLLKLGKRELALRFCEKAH